MSTPITGRRCLVCAHKDRNAIEESLIAAEPLASLAARTGTSISGLRRHRDAHLDVEVASALNAAKGMSAADVVARLIDIADRAKDLADQAEERHQVVAASRALQAERAALQVLANIGVKDFSQVNEVRWLEHMVHSLIRLCLADPEVAHAIDNDLREHGWTAAASEFETVLTTRKTKALEAA